MTLPLPEPMLQNIIENPTDDGPRLVAADYLEEHGACDRAEFVRVQVELARYERIEQSRLYRCIYCGVLPGMRHDSKCQSIVLRRRADALLAANEAEWVRHDLGLGKHFNTVDQKDGVFCLSSNQWWPAKLIWHRGFVSQVECRLADFVGETCQWCGGIGDEDLSREPCSTATTDCRKCHGTGRTPGLGALLVQRTPLREVRTEAKPQKYPFNRPRFVFGWHRGTMDNGLEEFNIPADLWESVTKEAGCEIMGPWADFPTAADAHAALSAALLRMAHEQAKAMPMEVVNVQA